ncbi:hypothetical protein IZ6_11170 [Terrihabitans soli]|uniref:Uncharacterized protein n=1 Tax=Terrihabitans soli TaxID=708113 RepID=A0A6S6QSZ7_9HYPH|nr:hypothetical protein [Terrihabitans soli]BCJ90382.1 hypothetical protein IZ6_11170 [Terrihabitans soli]
MKLSRITSGLFSIALISLGYAAEAAAEEYRFLPAPQIDLNRIYRVNRLTGEMGACQYAVKPDTVGIALCHPAGEGAGPQAVPGDYDLVRSNHEREGGIFRINTRTGEVSVCYVQTDKVVCTPQAK